uniref:BTB domain-containing protein n=1 Tax=Glossina palpalis gambiensis TaxID=67801 RepID=A0A1B0AZC2_9MUSC
MHKSFYDRAYLMDVTLVGVEKLLRAHKLVLNISSSYFQQIFIANPCKHSAIILNGITYNIMFELLKFMYRGVVNVKQSEIEAFVKIGERQQIKGFSTNSTSSAAVIVDKMEQEKERTFGFDVHFLDYDLVAFLYKTE